MNKVRAYKVKDFSAATDSSQESFVTSPLLSGVTDDIKAVSAALQSFPYRSAISLLGLAAVVFIAFKVGTRFGIIQARFKRKET